MGQQQLLLLVLGIVIVGIAIVVGINAYSDNSIRSNWDALLQEGLRIANDAQSWSQKPEFFGGSPDADKVAGAYFNNADLRAIGFSAGVEAASPALCYVSLNGVFEITQGATLLISGVNEPNQNEVVIEVQGATADDILTCSAAAAGQCVRGGRDTTSDTEVTVTTIACTPA